jgi:hypothetical protein
MWLGRKPEELAGVPEKQPPVSSDHEGVIYGFQEKTQSADYQA